AQNLKIIPVVNKIDLPSAQPEAVALQLIDLGFDENEICYTSGKTGSGEDDLLDKIIRLVPAPEKQDSEDTRALGFDSIYDDYRGVIAFVRVLSGKFTSRDTVKFVATDAKSNIVELGYLSPFQVKIDDITEGEVGYIATGLKSISDVRVGDTAT